MTLGILKLKIAQNIKKEYKDFADLTPEYLAELIDDWHGIRFSDNESGLSVSLGILGWYLLKNPVEEV